MVTISLNLVTKHLVGNKANYALAA